MAFQGKNNVIRYPHHVQYGMSTAESSLTQSSLEATCWNKDSEYLKYVLRQNGLGFFFFFYWFLQAKNQQKPQNKNQID